jgi:hypothetical protein
MLRCRKILLALAIMIATPSVVLGQATDSKPSPPEQALLKPGQLDALVAPIALYPDALVANLLAASTYPLEVVQADRWLNEHKKLKGDALKTEVDKQGWDDSVKALASTPTVLSMMSDKLDWTKDLGDAVLAQQPDVMDAIQRLRSKAHDNKKLTSTKEQKVTVQQQENKQVILIEPTDPNTIYVPYYEPAVVYGEWPYPDYPPYYFATPPYIGAGLIATGLAFGAGYALGRWSNYWRGGCNWGNKNFFINRNNVNNIGNNWQHNPAHRQGVRYNNAGVQQKFGNNNLRAGAADRMDFRGRGGEQVLNPGKDRPGAGDRAGAGGRGGADRTKVGDRGGGDRAKGGDHAKASDRAKGGDRAKVADRSRAGGAGSRGGRDTAIRNVSSGRAANLQSARGRASFASAGVSRASVGGGGFRGGGGGFHGGGGRGGGGGRRSDIALKHDVVLLGHLDNGLGYYRFSYLGSDKAYVGVIAQEVQKIMPRFVMRGDDGYLRVDYHRLGIRFLTYKDWLAAGAQIPIRAGMSR